MRGTPNDATSVNNRGEVVGTAESPSDGTLHTFLWTKDTGTQDLGAFPGAVVTVAPCCHTINIHFAERRWLCVKGSAGSRKAPTAGAAGRNEKALDATCCGGGS
jgi:probable HAF family extracellular repeat protein